ncbi:3-oxo-5-alpha-steroid 4-dehydrogenase-domain-containing protein [Mycena latifolia]|nr:3-oxo-5-alpha-steroid 4-dehydrogenase-domain-containing protein [Mycena latifolia]
MSLPGARKWFIIGSVVVAPAQLFINAPFGRFTPSQHSIFLVDGIKSWIVMELVSPIFFLYALFRGPNAGPPAVGSPKSILAGAYLIHYLNRALVSPLRTPSRSKSHLIVPLSAVLFNTLNGSLMGSFISSPVSPAPPIYFYAGLALWAFGFAGNVMHDEILLNIRRNAKDKPKGEGKGEHYAIPNGLLFNFVSYPNYFCEWLEWLGFALAADPRLAQSFFAGTLFSGRVSLASVTTSLSGPAAAFLPLVTPPWVFLLAEVLLMFPRAYRGHRWYHDKFGDRYPRERRIVVPFVL